MDETKIKDIMLGMTLASLASVIICAVFISGKYVNFKREAIERNYAEFNSTNGVWQWKAK